MFTILYLNFQFAELHYLKRVVVFNRSLGKLRILNYTLTRSNGGRSGSGEYNQDLMIHHCESIIAR